MNRKLKKTIVVVSIVLFCVSLVSLLLLFSGKVSLSVFGFAVDNANRIYVGTEKEISIIERGEKIGSISPNTSRTYAFTITEDETILLSTSTKVYTMDMDGNILSTAEDTGADIYNQLSRQKKKFISAKGDQYRLINMLGWTRILKNDIDVVYQIDVLSYIVKLLLGSVIISLLLVGTYVIRITLKDPQ